MVTLEDVKKMKVQVCRGGVCSCSDELTLLPWFQAEGVRRMLQELRDELEARNMPTTGLKAELLERLEEALAGGAENGEGATPGTSSSTRNS